MKIQMKIIAGFVLVTAIGMILGVFGLVSTQQLKVMSDDLYDMQKTNADVAHVLSAHYIWRQGLMETVMTGAEFNGSLDPGTCALGKWRDSEDAKSIADPEALALLSQINEPHAFIHNEAKIVVDLMQSGNSAEAEKTLVDVILPKTQEVITLLTSLDSRFTALIDEKSAEIIQFGDMISGVIVALVIAALIACALLAWRITISILKPINKIRESAEIIATGDVDVRVEYPVNDSIGSLASSFQAVVDGTRDQTSVANALAKGDFTVEIVPRNEKDSMNHALLHVVESFNEILGEIQRASEQVSSGSKQIADGSQSLAQGSTEQASAIEQLSSSISGITDKTNQNAATANEAAALSGEIRNLAETGDTQMDQMMQAVSDINEASNQIEKVIKVIDDIAFQTNILALNAAVEAARAGQHGKGFAVVAEEVRNLAAKSAKAAKDTGALIEDSIEKANLGLDIATQTSDSFKRIVDGINRSTEIVVQIARLSEEQSSAISQINIGIDQVAQVVQQNSATAEESAAASEEMSSQANMLMQTVARFSLKETGRRAPMSHTDNNRRNFSAISERAALPQASDETEYVQNKYMA